MCVCVCVCVRAPVVSMHLEMTCLMMFHSLTFSTSLIFTSGSSLGQGVMR